MILSIFNVRQKLNLFFIVALQRCFYKFTFVKIIKVNLEKYIYELLLKNETVIIPAFGAFVSVYKPAEIQGDQIKPPSKEISFTHQIRNNDGLLVGYVSRQEGISHFEALKVIEKQRENLVFQLEKGEKVVLEQTGTLWFNDNGEIEFEPFFDDNLLLDSYGLETISTKFMDQETDEINETEENTEVVAENLIQNESVVEKTGEDTADPEEPQQVSDSETENYPESTDQAEPELPEEPAVSVIGKTWSPDMAGEPEKRKKRSAIWYLLILVPIIIAGIFLLVNERKSPNIERIHQQEKNTVVEEAPLAKPDALMDDALENEIDNAKATTEVLADSIDTLVRQAKNEVATGTSKFYLVGGGFKGEDNAKDFVASLKDQGLDAFLLGKRGNFYLVAVGTYQSESEALKAKNAITEKDTAKNLWVLEE